GRDARGSARATAERGRRRRRAAPGRRARARTVAHPAVPAGRSGRSAAELARLRDTRDGIPLANSRGRMGSGSYVAYTGALSNQMALDVMANNVANVSTSGFRRDNTIFDSALGAKLHFASAESSRLDLSPGQQQLTGSPINAAIAGDGFFVVSMPGGEQLYT